MILYVALHCQVASGTEGERVVIKKDRLPELVTQRWCQGWANNTAEVNEPFVSKERLETNTNRLQQK